MKSFFSIEIKGKKYRHEESFLFVSNDNVLWELVFGGGVLKVNNTFIYLFILLAFDYDPKSF